MKSRRVCRTREDVGKCGFLPPQPAPPACQVVLVLAVLLLPLIMFSAQMARAKVRSMRDYSVLKKGWHVISI